MASERQLLRPMSADAEIGAILSTDRLVTDNWATLKTWDFFLPTQLWKEGKLKEEDITDIGEIILGEKPGRQSDDERILFANRGMGALDITVAERIYRTAMEKGIGQKLKLWDKPLWI